MRMILPVIVLVISFSSFAWEEATSVTSARDIFCIDGSTAWVAGDGGYVYITTNGGSTWSSTYLGYSDAVTCVEFANSTTGWAGCGRRILYTTNAGSTWSVELILPDGYSVQSISAYSTNDVWASGSYTGSHGFLVKRNTSWGSCLTTGSQIWAVQAQGGYNSTIAVDTYTTGYMIGRVAPDDDPPYFSITGVGPSTGYDAHYVDHCFPSSPSLGWINSSGNAWWTDDGGWTWNDYGDMDNCPLTCIDIDGMNPTVWFAYGSRGAMYSVQYVGSSWNTLALYPEYKAGVGINSICSSSSGSTVYVWATSQSGRVFRHSLSTDDMLSSPLVSQQIGFRIAEISDGNLTLSFDGPQTGQLTVDLYDISGHLIGTTSIDQSCGSGFAVEMPSGSNPMPMGVYCCRVSSSTGSSGCRSFVLLH